MAKKWCQGLIIFLSVCLISMVVISPVSADGFSVAKLMDELDRSEQEIVTRLVKSRVPDLFSSETDQKIAAAMISSFDSLREDKLNDAVSTVLITGADIFDIKGVLFRRFEENTYAGSLLRQADKYPSISKKIIRGLLNANTDWGKLSEEVLTDYAKQNYEKLKAEGVDLWREALTQIINPPEILGKAGIDPIDLYLQAVTDWRALVQQERRNWNRDIIDCVYRSFENLGDDFIGIDIAQAKCPFLNEGTFTGRLSRFLGDKRTSTAALGSLGLTPQELLPLMRKYQQQNPTLGENERPEFARWVEREFVRVAARNKRAHVENMRLGIKSGEQKFEAALNAQISKINGAYYQAILDVLGQEEMMRRHRTSVGQASGETEEQNLAENDNNQDVDIQEVRRVAAFGCVPDRISSALDLLEKRGANAAAISQARQRADTISLATNLLNRARADYRNGETDSAKDALQRARAITQRVKNVAKHCPDLVGSISAGLSQVSKADNAVDKINAALQSCDVQRINNYVSRLEGQQNLPSNLQKGLRRLQNAMLVLDPFEIIFADAQRLADRGNQNAARKEAQGLKAELEQNGLRSCGEYRQVTGFLADLRQNDALRTQANTAARACNIGTLQSIKDRASGGKYESLRNSIDRAIANCQKPQQEKKKGLYEGRWVSVKSYWAKRRSNNPSDDSRTVDIFYDTPTSGRFRYSFHDRNNGNKTTTQMARWTKGISSSKVNIVWTEDGGKRTTYRFLKLTPDYAILETDIEAARDLDGNEGGKLVIEFKRVR